MKKVLVAQFIASLTIALSAQAALADQPPCRISLENSSTHQTQTAALVKDPTDTPDMAAEHYIATINDVKFMVDVIQPEYGNGHWLRGDITMNVSQPRNQQIDAVGELSGNTITIVTLNANGLDAEIMCNSPTNL